MHADFLTLLIPSAGAQLSVGLRLLAAAVCGVCLGFERSIAGKHAGMRTYALVSTGSALFVLVGTFASLQFASFNSLNPLQIAASVVLGVGFIGAGLAGIRGQQPGEITTASGVWVAAGIGMACGFGFFILASLTTLIALATLIILLPIEKYIRTTFNRTHNAE